jgi:hypothetical protein
MISEDNTVIGYAAGYAVVINEEEKVYVVEAENEMFGLGTSIEGEILIPISKIPEKDQSEITNWLEKGE